MASTTVSSPVPVPFPSTSPSKRNKKHRPKNQKFSPSTSSCFGHFRERPFCEDFSPYPHMVLFIDEILLHIFFFLDAPDLLQVTRVNWRWCNVCLSEDLWSTLYLRSPDIPLKRENKYGLPWRTFFLLERKFQVKMTSFSLATTETSIRLPSIEVLHLYGWMGSFSSLLEMDTKLLSLLFKQWNIILQREKRSDSHLVFRSVDDLIDKLSKEMRFGTSNKERDLLMNQFLTKFKDRITCIINQGIPWWNLPNNNSRAYTLRQKSVAVEDRDWVRGTFSSALLFPKYHNKNESHTNNLSSLDPLRKLFWDLNSVAESTSLYLALNLSFDKGGKQVSYFGILSINPFLVNIIHFKNKYYMD